MCLTALQPYSLTALQPYSLTAALMGQEPGRPGEQNAGAECQRC